MTEKMNPSWINSYKNSLKNSIEHQNIEVSPINGSLLKEIINQQFDSVSIEPINRENFPDLFSIGLDFTAKNSVLYTGISSNNESGQDNQKSAAELTNIVSALIYDQGKDLNLSTDITNIFSNPTHNPNIKDITRGIYRGIETARQCHACEQVDSKVGAQIHVASSLLSRVFDPNDFKDFWESNYYAGAILELNNPQTIGFVDVLIKTVELNQEKYPALTKFFGSELNLPESDFKGTYFDMVDMPEYQ